MPTSPHHAAGLRTLPPAAAPRAMSTRPAATAAPEPDEDPPVAKAGLTGLREAPKAEPSPRPRARSSRFVFPVMVAPASRTRSTTTASSVGTTAGARRPPLVVGTPATARQ